MPRALPVRRAVLRLLGADGSKELYARAASADKTLKTYAGLRHEILNEPREARHRVIRDISEWIEARL